MQFKNSLIASAALVASAVAQSPAGFSPSTKTPLGIKFGNTILFPNETLPQSLPDTVTPTPYSAIPYLSKYMLLLVDLSIPEYFFTDEQIATLVPGLGAGRTTRLHWWQTNVTHDILDGSFKYDSGAALAPYAGPQPPAGDSAHDYVFWLFPQPSNFVAPAAALAGEFDDPSSDARFNFSLPALAKQVGNPIAANYMRVENAANPGAVTTVPAVALPTSISVSISL
ncbi:hypothetical protein B9Z65_4011 [Elsinoe australis]|uniref:PEBP-like protein n=1 Tax=Elsinoe australis TaxID=40998 RepID=A0A2P7Z1K7_9PEZI|nr:hypothetical protein B9Z65_4011 [Elsinoe australis]